MGMPVALITGASKGLGRTIATSLSEKGFNIAASYLSSDEQIGSLVCSFQSDFIILKGDIGDSKHVGKMSDMIKEKYGRLDIIVNNAGITKDNLLIKQTEKEWDVIINTNLKGCFNIIKMMSPLMIKSGGGHIINISSFSGVKGKAGQAAYSASKAAIVGLTYTAAHELAEYNIKVNAILPGYMKTDMGLKAGRAMEDAKKQSLLGVLSSPQKVAEFICYLINTEHITGQLFSLDSRIL